MKKHKLTKKLLNKVSQELKKNTFATWQASYKGEWEWLTMSSYISWMLQKIPQKYKKDRKFLKAWLQLHCPEVSNHDKHIQVFLQKHQNEKNYQTNIILMWTNERA